MKPLVIAVTGGRDIDPGGPSAASRAMAAQFRAFWRVAYGWSRTGEVILSVGDAGGVDAWVRTARAFDQELWPHHLHRHVADWRRGKGAGHERNFRVLMGERPFEEPQIADLLIAFPGGRGTADCVHQAGELGIETWQIDLHLYPWQRGEPRQVGVYWTWDGHWRRRREWVPGRGWRLRPGHPEWERSVRCWCPCSAECP